MPPLLAELCKVQQMKRLCFGGAYERSRRGGEENPVQGQNTTVNVGKIRSFRPRHVWTKPFVFLPAFDCQPTDRCFLYACYGNPYKERVVHSTAEDTVYTTLFNIGWD